MSHLKNLQNLDKELADAVDTVVKTYGIDPKVIMTGRRDTTAVQSRFAVWYILFTKHGWSSPVIGDIFDKDHSTILHGIQRAKELGIPTELGRVTVGQPVEKTKNHGDKKGDIV